MLEVRCEAQPRLRLPLQPMQKRVVEPEVVANHQPPGMDKLAG